MNCHRLALGSGPVPMRQFYVHTIAGNSEMIFAHTTVSTYMLYLHALQNCRATRQRKNATHNLPQFYHSTNSTLYINSAICPSLNVRVALRLYQYVIISLHLTLLTDSTSHTHNRLTLSEMTDLWNTAATATTPLLRTYLITPYTRVTAKSWNGKFTRVRCWNWSEHSGHKK